MELELDGASGGGLSTEELGIGWWTKHQERLNILEEQMKYALKMIEIFSKFIYSLSGEEAEKKGKLNE